MMEVVLNIKIPNNWIDDLKQRFPAPLKFVKCMPHGRSGGRSLVEIGVEDGMLEEILEAIRDHPSVCKAKFSPLRDGIVLGNVTLQECVACQALTGSECFLMSAKTDDEGGLEWRLITGGEGSLIELKEKLEENGCAVELKSKTRLSKKAMLTGRQEEIMRAAFKRGYYDQPKQITIKELAKTFDISSSTLAEILQKGEKKIIQQRFRE